MNDEEKRNQKEIRCPIHKKLLGKYDARYGCLNVTYYCPQCKSEYTFTFSANFQKKN